ncbi:hypothetical protein [Microbacterium pygmaeum]|uniref:CdiI immunity protein domain-containing protein n=1 Tax=Microbacterium pygmaeum TaxID=370764 RepID=A0A1G7XIV1_9MICO|nr:hypothetical protein [Microbacterium pygmaeum]SDG84094.1 hypothetical protein SAMN04489810_1439 [Microbacterium pygmaeum]
MALPQERFDELLHRTALAALFYYPEIAVDDADYNLQSDIDYCLEPVAALGADELNGLRAVVGRVITNPSAHRTTLMELIIELAPEPSPE